MKKVFILVSALLLGFAISATAQDNRSTSSQNPRETHNVSSSSTTQSPRETHRVDSNTEANSRRPSIAPKQQNDNRQSSSRTTSSGNNSDRVQRDATKTSQYEYGKPRN